MRAMIYSPEFWSREAYRKKSRPRLSWSFHGARRWADVDTPPAAGRLGGASANRLSMSAADGLRGQGGYWVNTGALLNRLNFSLALAGNRMRGSRTDVGSLLGVEATADAKAALERAVQVFLGASGADNRGDA
jgi:hypothetical protein